MGVVHHYRALGPDEFDPGGREIWIRGRQHPAASDREHGTVVHRHDHPDAVGRVVLRLHDLGGLLRVDADRLAWCKTPEHEIDVVGRFHRGWRKLYAPADLLSEIAGDVTAHQRADGLAD